MRLFQDITYCVYSMKKKNSSYLYNSMLSFILNDFYRKTNSVNSICRVLSVILFFFLRLILLYDIHCIFFTISCGLQQLKLMSFARRMTHICIFTYLCIFGYRSIDCALYTYHLYE